MKKNYLLNSIYQILTLLVPFITTPYISRTLQASGIGAYSYTFSIASYLGIFLTIGMEIYGQLQVAKYGNDKENCGKLVFGVFGAKCMTTFVVLIVYCMLESRLNMYQNVYWIMILYFFSLLFDFTWFFQGMEEFVYIVCRNVVVKLVGIAGIFLFVKEPGDVVIYAGLLHGTSLVGNLWMIPQLRKYITVIPLKDIRIFAHMCGGFIYLIPTIATSVYTVLDKFMIGWITKSSYENGYYEQSYKIIQISLVLLTSVRTVTLPRVANLYSESRFKEINRLIDKSIQAVLCLSIPMGVGIASVASQLVPVFLGESFQPCVRIVQVLSGLIMVLGLSTLISGQCLTALGRQKQANLCVIVGACINLAMNCILIPSLGAMGAAVATVCSETVIMLMFIAFGRNALHFRKIGRYFVRYSVCGFVMFLILRLLDNLSLPAMAALLSKIMVGCVIYGALLMLVKDEVVAAILSLVNKWQKKEY